MAPRTKEVPRGGEAKLSRATARLRATPRALILIPTGVKSLELA